MTNRTQLSIKAIRGRSILRALQESGDIVLRREDRYSEVVGIASDEQMVQIGYLGLDAETDTTLYEYLADHPTPDKW